MRIRKTSNTRALAGKVVNVASESTTDTYSCDYVNDLIIIKTYSRNITQNGNTSDFWVMNMSDPINIPTGYSLLGIVNVSTSTMLTAQGWNISPIISTENDAVYAKIDSTGTSDKLTATITMNVLFIKNN